MNVTMSESPHPIIQARRAQMFPTLAPADIDRLRRFGETRSYGLGERIIRAGDVAPGHPLRRLLRKVKQALSGSRAARGAASAALSAACAARGLPTRLTPGRGGADVFLGDFNGGWAPVSPTGG